MLVCLFAVFKHRIEGVLRQMNKVYKHINRDVVERRGSNTGVTSGLKKYILHSKVDLWMVRGSLIT